jgi:hypothetical protein
VPGHWSAGHIDRSATSFRKSYGFFFVVSLCVPPMPAESPPIAPPVLWSGFGVDAAGAIVPVLPVVVLPVPDAAMCALSAADWLMLEPLLMLPELELFIAELSDAGATVPPTAVVSVVVLLSPLLHAATATRAATNAMRFMNPPSRK